MVLAFSASIKGTTVIAKINIRMVLIASYPHSLLNSACDHSITNYPFYYCWNLLLRFLLFSFSFSLWNLNFQTYESSKEAAPDPGIARLRRGVFAVTFQCVHGYRLCWFHQQGHLTGSGKKKRLWTVTRQAVILPLILRIPERRTGERRQAEELASYLEASWAIINLYLH